MTGRAPARLRGGVAKETALPRWFVVLAVALLLTSGDVARAGTPGVNLSWSGCALDAASGQRCFTCDGKAGAPFVIQGTFRPLSSIPDFAATSTLVDVEFDQGTTQIPDFWKMATGDCDAQAITMRDPTTTDACALPNIFSPGSTGGGVSVSYPTAYRLRFRFDWAVADTASPPIVSGKLYPAFAGVIDADLGVASGCAGCAVSASLQILQVEVFGYGAGEHETITVQDQRNGVLWQAATGIPCTSVPTRTTTWGAVKALYR
jgi:hypothetical protein